MTLQTVKLSPLEPHSGNPRSFFDVNALEGLATSNAQGGILQNLVVRPIESKKKPQRCRIIAGERRYRALQSLLKKGAISEDYEVAVELRSDLSKASFVKSRCSEIRDGPELGGGQFRILNFSETVRIRLLAKICCG